MKAKQIVNGLMECYRCQKWLPLSAFYKSHRTYCKPCNKEVNRLYSKKEMKIGKCDLCGGNIFFPKCGDTECEKWAADKEYMPNNPLNPERGTFVGSRPG